MTAVTVSGPRTIDPARLARAVHLDVEHDIDGWTVTGGSAPHRVTDHYGRLDCDCTDRQLRGTGCKHILAVLLRRGHPAVLVELRGLIPSEVTT